MLFTIGQEIGERYIVRQELYGKGGFFNIWLADDIKLERQVAIKTVREASSDKMLREESLQMAQLEYPYLIPIYDSGIENERFYMVMRYISNTSLSSILRSKQLTLQTIFHIAERVANALDYLHKAGFVHGNLKASNVILDEHLEPYLGNFLMRHFSQDKRVEFARSGKLGTVYNLTPEEIIGEEISKASDIYAFGLMLHHCLTGELAFGRYESLAEKQLEQGAELPLVRSKRPEISAKVDIVLRHLTQQKIENRYDSAGQAVDDLREAIFSQDLNIEGKVFISYARKDSDYVHKLAKELRQIGLDIWIDQDIQVSTNWDDAIEQGLNECDMMLLITTESSMSSEYVTHEWSYFMGRGKPVYPFIPQDPIPENIHPRLSRVQHIVGTDDILNNVARIIDALGSAV